MKAAGDDTERIKRIGGVFKPVSDYQGDTAKQTKALEDIKKFKPILQGHLEREKGEPVQAYLRESLAQIDLVLGDRRREDGGRPDAGRDRHRARHGGR